MFKRLGWISVLLGSTNLGCTLLLRTDGPDGEKGTGGMAGAAVAGGHGGPSAGSRGGTAGGAAAGRSGGSSGGGGAAGFTDAGGGGGSNDADNSADADRPPMDAGLDAGLDASSCITGVVCTPTNQCHVGRTVCSTTGTMLCLDAQLSQANGTVCGQNMVCGNGACVACQAGSTCTATNPCRTASNVCTTGMPVCTENGDTPNGTICGVGMVCLAGLCTTCQAGTACTPSNPCH